MKKTKKVIWKFSAFKYPKNFTIPICSWNFLSFSAWCANGLAETKPAVFVDAAIGLFVCLSGVFFLLLFDFEPGLLEVFSTVTLSSPDVAETNADAKAVAAWAEAAAETVFTISGEGILFEAVGEVLPVVTGSFLDLKANCNFLVTLWTSLSWRSGRSSPAGSSAKAGAVAETLAKVSVEGIFFEAVGEVLPARDVFVAAAVRLWLRIGCGINRNQIEFTFYDHWFLNDKN